MPPHTHGFKSHFPITLPAEYHVHIRKGLMWKKGKVQYHHFYKPKELSDHILFT